MSPRPTPTPANWARAECCVPSPRAARTSPCASATCPLRSTRCRESSWPYGRVVAIEEAHDTPASARPAVRRNVEAAIKTLGDMGVVVYEWPEAGLR